MNDTGKVYVRRIDIASLLLLVVGVASVASMVWLVVTRDTNLLFLIPGLLATVTGARNLVKVEAHEVPGSFCVECPDHEPCASGLPCDVVQRIEDSHE